MKKKEILGILLVLISGLAVAIYAFGLPGLGDGPDEANAQTKERPEESAGDREEALGDK